MTVLLYIEDWKSDEAALTGVLRETVPWVGWETCRNWTHLTELMSQPGREWAAVVAAVGSPESLRGLQALRGQLSRLGLLLILPSQDEPLVALGHRLAPRLLAGGSDAPCLIAQVLDQMMRNLDSRAPKNQQPNLG